MQIYGVTASSGTNSAQRGRATQGGTSFQETLQAALAAGNSGSSTSGSSSTSSSSNSSTSSSSSVSWNRNSDAAVQDFMSYMKEPPVQRMFDAWLNAQHISKAEYNALPADQKAKLQASFQQYLKKKMTENLGTSGGVTAAAGGASTIATAANSLS